MIDATFGPGHTFLAAELRALAEIMSDNGMSNRSVAMVIALCSGQSASDYAYHLQDVSWQAQNPRSDTRLKDSIRARMMNFGYAEWAQEA